MARGAHEIPKKNKFPAWGLILLLLLTLSVGGVTAYLSASDSLTNSFTPNAPATVTVDDENRITVNYQRYGVYLRAAVVANWVKDGDPGHILGETPVLGTDYEMTTDPTDNWYLHDDGFYYYNTAIEKNLTTTPVAQLASGAVKDGYRVKIKVLAQVVQAVGETDGDPNANPVIPPVPAVVDAWGVEASEFIGKTN